MYGKEPEEHEGYTRQGSRNVIKIAETESKNM